MLMTGKQRKVGEVEDKCFKWKKSFVCKSVQLKTLHFDQPLHASTVSLCFLTPETEDILGLWQVIVIRWSWEKFPGTCPRQNNERQTSVCLLLPQILVKLSENDYWMYSKSTIYYELPNSRCLPLPNDLIDNIRMFIMFYRY